MELKQVPCADWPPAYTDGRVIQLTVGRVHAVWRSRGFVLVDFVEHGRHRLSINRTALNSQGGWQEAITWDELQRLKRQAGYGNQQAIEFYPPEDEVVNVANMRHLWIMDEPLAFQWNFSPKVICAVPPTLP